MSTNNRKRPHRQRNMPMLSLVSVVVFLCTSHLAQGFTVSTGPDRVYRHQHRQDAKHELTSLDARTRLFQSSTPQDDRDLSQTLQQRLNDVARLEQALQQRLGEISRTEKNLESRLASIPNVNRTPDRQRSGDNIATTGGAVAPITIDELWEKSPQTSIQGGRLRTWSFESRNVKRVFVLLKTDGRPLDANVELWQGPDNAPQKMKVYVEDAGLRTFSVFINTPRNPSTIFVKNTGHLEFPLVAAVGQDETAGESCLQALALGKAEIIQGASLRTYAFESNVKSVAVLIKTDGRPLTARIELLQGPNNNKQVMSLYSEDGLNRPFMVVISTPGIGNVVRVVNTAPVEFPLFATTVEYEVDTSVYSTDGLQLGHDDWSLGTMAP